MVAGDFKGIVKGHSKMHKLENLDSDGSIELSNVINKKKVRANK